MAAPVELTRLFDALNSTDDKKNILHDIKTCLLSSALSNHSLINANTFENLFSCLKTSDGEQIKLVCDVLNILLNYIEPENVLNQFHAELQAGIVLPEVQVRELCAKQVLRAAEAGVHVVIPHSNLVSQAVLLIGDENLSTAQQCVNLLICLGRENEGLELIFQGNVFDQIKTLMVKGDVVRFRIYEAMVKIASVSPETLYVCTQSGLLTQLINELATDDILLQLNVLELLKELALVHHGIVYLEQEGIIDRLQEMLRRVDDDPLMSFLLPGLVKFFGNIAHQQPKEICGRFQAFINLVFTLVNSEDISLRVIAMETLCFVGESSEGKLALEKQGDRMKNACKSMGMLMGTAATEYRIRVMQAVNTLLMLKVADQTAELLSLTEQWYLNLFSNPLETMLNVAQQPFIQLRCAALEHFATIAVTSWGQKMLNSHPGFNEYLLNRSTENSKEGKEEKYSIVKVLVESPTVQEIFGQPYYMKLKVYEREGPFYILAEAAVALEGL